MAIIKHPANVAANTALHCALCEVAISFAAATAGAQSVDGRQEFICDKHLRNSEQLIRDIARHTLSRSDRIARSLGLDINKKGA